ncbi:TetR/AcrR family transcriptional regulator [Microbacterium candidum]|uniref:TetR family transcriptional regulator n=1 Tax=Microbacterium candidum TaxID=3041922 RepID=A0ABT7MTN4_9MICO|nr:TetR/AcrR family transcriptional regulator [Microbacterium sp. ASV49]MDL9977807.1 TetR family transcriptional regulator [Microbacterium sp. ASV49]
MSRPLPSAVAAATHGDRDAVRDHILDAALRVVERDGLAGASTRAISAESGLAAGTMYNYFAGRLDVVASAIVRRSERTAEPIADFADLAGTGTVRGNLDVFAQRAGRVLDELLPLVAAAFADADLLQELRRRVAASPRLANPIAGLERYLAAEARLGRVRSDADLPAVCALVGSLCHDDAFQRHLVGFAAPPRARELAVIAAMLEPVDRKDR